MLKRVALTTFAWTLAVAPAFGQDFGSLEEQFELFAAEDVVVSASKHEQKASEAPSAIYVITAREIEASSATSLGDLLRRVPGFDVYRVNGGYSIIGARGLATEQNNLVLVLLDGREVNIELFGIPFVEQIPVTLSEIERIEVIRGPGSALYGANAFSGVVSIITKKPKEDGSVFEPFIVAGNYRVGIAEARAAARKGKFVYQASGRFRRSNLTSNPDAFDYKTSSARALFSYDFSEDSQLTADVGFDGSKTQIFTTIGEMPADLFQTGTRVSYALGHWKTDLFWNVLDAELSVQDATLNPPGTALDERILTNLNGLANTFDLQSQYMWEMADGANRLTFGGNVRWNNFASDVLADPSANEYRFGVYLQDEYRPVDSLVLAAGARLDYYLFESPLCAEIAPSVSCNGAYQSVSPQVSPRASVVYTPVRNQTFRLTYGNAFRKPAFFERQMQVAALERLNLNFANPELPNEKVTAYEFGYVTRFGERVKMNVDLFYNQYENFIIFQPNKVQFDIQTENGQPVKVNAMGGEVGTKIVITEEIEGGASYAYLQKSPDDLADPAHKVNGELTYRAGYGMVANVFAAYISERQWRISNPELGNLIVPLTSGQTLGNYVVLDARLGYRMWENRMEIGLLGKNLLDQHREFPGLAALDVDQDPFTARENYGGEFMRRTGMLYVEGSF